MCSPQITGFEHLFVNLLLERERFGPFSMLVATSNLDEDETDDLSGPRENYSHTCESFLQQRLQLEPCNPYLLRALHDLYHTHFSTVCRDVASTHAIGRM
jgi:hypothetical protein